MHQHHKRLLITLASGAMLALSAGQALAYQEDERIYQANSEQLLPWDHDGELPEGDARYFELRKLREQLHERQHRLTVSLFLLNAMESQVRDPQRYASLRRDYENQLISFARWKESAERRRQAILEAATTTPKVVPQNP